MNPETSQNPAPQIMFVFLYSEEFQKEIKKAVQFIIASRRVKFLVINRTKMWKACPVRIVMCCSRTLIRQEEMKR